VIAIRLSPGSGENANPETSRPGCLSSAIVAPVTASMERSEGWSTSPSSMTSSTAIASSADSARRSTAPVMPQPPASRTG
jgi:hypothetical protein